MVKIRWLREAQNDLKEIFEYISPDSRRYAKLQIERIQKRTESLKNQPRLGKVVQEMEDPQIRD